MDAAQNDAVAQLYVRPDRLLTQNRNLARDRIYNWTIPAYRGQLADGREYNTCPSAGVCAQACYARAGSYRFSNVLARHERNLAYVLDDLDGWKEQMVAETGHKRHQGGAVRIHDAGDFFSDAYTAAWLEIAQRQPNVLYYCYTKEVARFRRLVEGKSPANFKWVYSFGGKHDRRLDPARDRVADVFPTVEALVAAGYHDQAASDLLAVNGPAPVGMAANNIRHFQKIQGPRSFREWQAEHETARAEERAMRKLAAEVDAWLRGDR